MSNNAVAAYANGEMPISKWSKRAIIEAVRQIDSEKADMLKGLPLSVLRKKVLYNSSWHHTSKMYNKTEFYSIDVDVVDEITEETVQE